MKIEYVPKSVIENRLLVALEEDSSKVAILASEQDLLDMHAALCGYKLSVTRGNLVDWSEHECRCRELAKGIKQLLDSAFHK